MHRRKFLKEAATDENIFGGKILRGEKEEKEIKGQNLMEFEF